MPPRRPPVKGNALFPHPRLFPGSGAPPARAWPSSPGLAVRSGFLGGHFRNELRTRLPNPDPTGKQVGSGRMRVVCTDGRLPVPVPEPALVVLVGPSGSAKSTWAAAHLLA